MIESTVPSMRTRLIGALLVLGTLGVAWWYVASHDVVGGFRRFQSGQFDGRGGGPRPRAHHNTMPAPGELVGAAWSTVRVPVLVGAALVAIALAAIVAVRLRERRRRAERTETWQLVLGREDLAMPYEVEQAIEGVCGQLRARWYERIVFGQDHFALEIHYTTQARVAFTLAAPARAVPALRAALENLYPDVQLERVAEGPDRPGWFCHVVRLKKRRTFIYSLATTRDYQHSFVEGLVAALAQTTAGISVQLVLVPAPLRLQKRARRLLVQHERELNWRDRRDPLDPGSRSVVAAKESKGALETQHRALFFFDLRVAGVDRAAVRRVAGLYDELRSENELARRYMRLRARLYQARMATALPNPLPSFGRGVISSSEFATLWHLPRVRAKHAPIARASVRRAVAPPAVCRDPAYQLMRDELGPVGLWPADRKFGLALMGGQGMGKSSTMMRVALADALDPDKAIVVVDPKEDLARLLLALMPEWRTVHYLDLGAPECGLNPLTVPGSPESIASLFVQSLIEANPPGAIQAASDAFLRNAVAAVAAVEGNDATVQHVYQMFSQSSAYRDRVIAGLSGRPELAFIQRYWAEEFPALIGDKSFAATRLDPPKNKLSRLITGIDLALRHPHQLDIDGIVERGEVLIVNGAKGQAGEDNTRLMGQIVMQLVHRALQRQQRLERSDRRKLSLLVDEAHNFLTPTVATLLAEGRSAGLEATFAWQYTGQIAHEGVRSGVRSLLQSVSLFRMREMEDARSMAGLAMEVYSDKIDTHEDSQERLRFSVEDVLRLPQHRAINLWVAQGSPQAGHVGVTLEMETGDADELDARRELHLQRQREAGGGHREWLPDPLRDVELETETDVDEDDTYESAVRPEPAGEAQTATPDPDDDEHYGLEVIE